MCGYWASAAASKVQSRIGLSPLARTVLSSALAASKSSRKVKSVCSRATALAPTTRPSATSLCQCTLQTKRLSPKAQPQARIASICSEAISLRMSAQAQPMAVCPDGYEPFLAKHSHHLVSKKAPCSRRKDVDVYNNPWLFEWNDP